MFIKFFKQLYAKIRGNSTDRNTEAIDPKVIREYALTIAMGERMLRITSGQIQQPYGYVLSVLMNMIALSNYIRNKLPDFIESKKLEFEEQNRDFKVLIRNFDAIVANHLQRKIEAGLNLGDLDRLKEEIDYVFRNMIYKEWYDWFNNSQNKLNQHISMLVTLCHSDTHAEQAYVVSTLLQQVLQAGPISEIIEADDSDRD